MYVFIAVTTFSLKICLVKKHGYDRLATSEGKVKFHYYEDPIDLNVYVFFQTSQ